jgi:hypothetical protein
MILWIFFIVSKISKNNQNKNYTFCSVGLRFRIEKAFYWIWMFQMPNNNNTQSIFGNTFFFVLIWYSHKKNNIKACFYIPRWDLYLTHKKNSLFFYNNNIIYYFYVKNSKNLKAKLKILKIYELFNDYLAKFNQRLTILQHVAQASSR